MPGEGPEEVKINLNLNPVISSWLNGTDFSLRRMRGRPYAWLVDELSRLVKSPIRSIAEAYGKAFEGGPGAGSVTVTAGRDPDPEWESRPFLRPLRELRDFVRENFSADEILGFYVHGSLATMDYVEGYSDFDTLVVVRHPVLEDTGWLADFRRRLSRSNAFLYLLDPLQHHHHFVLTEYDLDHYMEPVFPLVLFDYCAELSDYQKTIEVRLQDSADLLAATYTFWHRYLGDPSRWASATSCGYALKHYIQSLLMMPAVFVQASKGEYRYKKHTFEAARSLLPADAWAAVEKATQVRNICPFHSLYPYSFRKFVGLRLHHGLLHRLHRRLDRDNARVMSGVLGPDFHHDVLRLLKAMAEVLPVRTS